MKIEYQTETDYHEYSSFISKNSNSTFYHSEKFLKFIETLLKLKLHTIKVKDGDEIVGILPFFVKDSKYGKVVNSLPFFGSYGGVISKNNEINKKILEEMNTFNKENDVLSSVIISNPFDPSDLYEKFFKYDIKQDRRIQCTDLYGHNPDSLWNSLEKRTRWSIRKSEKNHVDVSTLQINDDRIIDFYTMHKRSMEIKKGKSKPLEFFNNLANFFTIGKDYDIFVGTINSQQIAYVLIFYYGNFTEYYQPAFDENWKSTQATSALIWKSILKSLEKKKRFYNFGGTWPTQKELYLFKRSWNARDFSYFYYVYRDLERIKDISFKVIQEEFPNFFVTPYEEINNTS